MSPGPTGAARAVAAACETLVEPIMTPLFALLSRHIGIVTVCDVQVVRPEHF